MFDYERQQERRKKYDETLDLIVCVLISGLAVYVLYRWLA